jgi:uncharacterized HAD superfamily protein
MTLSLQNPNVNSIISNALDNLKNLFGFVSSKSQPQLEIQNLVQRLSELQDVEQVRAIRHNKNDLYEITFEILCCADFHTTRKVAEEATRLVVETEWKLCDITKQDDWDFGTQILREFTLNVKKNQIVSSSDVKSVQLSTAS